MFKRIKELEAYEKFKELRANPKTKALSSLIIWLLFFVIIIIFVRGMNGNANHIPQQNYNNSIITNYEYTYNNGQVVIFGKKYGDKQLFIVSNNKYYYDGNNGYLVNGDSLKIVQEFDLGLLKIDLDMINNLTDRLSFREIGEDREYIVPLVNFINLFEIDTAVDLSLANNYNIIIRKYYKNNDLYKVDIDLSNYYLYNNQSSTGKLTINLYNKNKLNNFSLDYEKMLGV